MFAPAKRHLGKYENVTLDYPASMADTEENYRGKPGPGSKNQRNSWHGVDLHVPRPDGLRHILQALLRDAAERR